MKKCFNVGEIKNYTKRLYIKIRPYIKPFLVVFIIYFVALSSILRANYSYMDDAGRAVNGYAWTSDFNRVSSSLLGFAMNVNLKLADISPLPQIVAIAMLSISSVAFTYVFCKGQIRYLPLLASCYIGLTPFMYGCWVFKFDAPCMALSILASIIPILFWNKLMEKSTRQKVVVLSITIVCLLIMLTSYQASSGVIVVLVLGLSMVDLLRGEKIEDVLKKAVLYCVAYLASAILFKLIFPDVNGSGYRETEIFQLNEMLSGVFNNVLNMLLTVLSSMNVYWRLLTCVVIVCFVISAISYGSKRIGVLRSLGVLLIALPLMTIFSYGVYIVLRNAPITGRSFVGISSLLAVLAMTTFVFAKKQACVVAAGGNLLLLYSFIVYGLAFGNGLADQKEYAGFRIQQLINELVASDVDIDSGSSKLKLRGDIGPSPVMRHVIDLYPITNSIFDLQSGLNDKSYWGYRQPIDFYGVHVEAVENEEVVCDEVLSSSRYYNISRNSSGGICVDIK